MEKTKIIHQKPTRQQTVDRLLERLPAMQRGDLLQLWRNLLERVPTPALRRELLIPILAYRIQEQAFGGLRESTARKRRVGRRKCRRRGEKPTQPEAQAWRSLCAGV